jgi:hypothetical protein
VKPVPQRGRKLKIMRGRFSAPTWANIACTQLLPAPLEPTPAGVLPNIKN